MTTKKLAWISLMIAASVGAPACTQSAADAEQSEDALRLLPVSEQAVLDARASRDPAKIAALLHALASDRTNLWWNHADLRVSRTKQLLSGLTPERVRAIRAAYIASHDEDPEITMRSDGLAQPLVRLDRAAELEMVGALNEAQMTEDARALGDMYARATQGELTSADRAVYFKMLPRMGLWDAPVRAVAGDHALDALERTLLIRAWGARGQRGASLDAALRAIEAKLPAVDLAVLGPRERSVAVVASSHGAQWQELTGWMVGMVAGGYKLQLFTPDGRPAAFQRDSLSVSTKTVSLGFGCPPDLDPAGRTGEIAADLFANTTGAERFDATQFGAVYLAGGLGFNEDVAVARPGRGADGRERTMLTANPNIASFMQKALADKLPLIAICHGPTLFAATPINVGNGVEALNKGIETASLPPFESYVGFTERKEIQFTYDVNTHEVLARVGGRTSVLADIANMKRVVSARKADIDIITGPGPQAASALAAPTIDAMRRKWGR